MEKKEENHIKTEKGDPDSVYKQKPRRNNRPKKDEFDELMKRDEKDDGRKSPVRGGGDVEKTVSIFLEKVRKAVNTDPDALKRVVAALDGADFGDEKLSVRARGGGIGGKDRKARPPRAERGSDTKPEYKVDPCHLYIGNLAYATEEDTLIASFSEFGEIVRLRLLRR